MIARVNVVLRRTVCGDIDWRFDNLSGSHHQSQPDDFRSVCRNVNQCHHKHSFLGLHSPGRSYITDLCYDSCVQTIYSKYTWSKTEISWNIKRNIK